jgi:predicted negative regulator of RcsB-dependent stress response|tara:strand:- start:813 stop:1457 length:645 start_codon:yes stop_codon:yes gene_type:complete
MSEVFENNMKFAPFMRFYNNHKVAVISVITIIIALISISFVMSNIAKSNNLKAAVVYQDWLLKNIDSVDGEDGAVLLFDELTSSYKNTGYAQIALLTKGSSDARNGNNEAALISFSKLINLTNGMGGNKLFNKIARVSSARLLSANGELNEALKVLEKYSSSSTNAYIHELTGDILLKKEEKLLAKEQYILAKDKYADETSIAIVSIKISNLKS